MDRPEWATDGEAWADLCSRVRRAASAFLAGQTSVIEAAREFSALRHAVRAEWDEDFLVFVGIDSESDDLPIGKVRELWSERAVAEADAKRLAYEEKCQPAARVAASNLLAKYES